MSWELFKLIALTGDQLTDTYFSNERILMTELDQATILLQIGLGSPGPAFHASKDQITISKETFREYFAASDIIEKIKKQHHEHPVMDGYHIIERKRSGKFQLLLMERGQALKTSQLPIQKSLLFTTGNLPSHF
jgi:hypothetical protein